MKKITCCEDVNNINNNKNKYYDHRYEISIGISNALYYIFRVYAQHETDALEQLASFLQNNNASGLYETYDQLQELGLTEEEIDNDYIYVDGGIYFDSGYIAMHEITYQKDFKPVIFRKFKDGNIIALFPSMPWGENKNNCMSYQHIGQHGEASIDIISDTIPAKQEEYNSLLHELQQTYDDLRVYQKIQDWMNKARIEIMR